MSLKKKKDEKKFFPSENKECIPEERDLGAAKRMGF